ncbi:MAG: S24 family peptidase, partial [Candidatus Poseidonia sp.]|nr:S24 family peptidase [Poseidonia sp.]
GHSMWPTFSDGDVLRMNPIASDESLIVGDVVLAKHPFKPSVLVVKRIQRIEDDGRLFLVGDQSDPTASEDSHNFGPVARHEVQAKWNGVVERA